ncbi:unnamed protein product [Brachionus calyciflorus]|uniref:Peptidase A2 domain-containing protein n=1 Tax=Brachionus calyciflorus TaxID=104777 RepID=A0A814P1M1_9BILA|nr:unnamed protein product [Brachionus calyciflorus]
MIAAKSDISKEETIKNFFMSNLNSKRMVKYINQAVTLQSPITILSSINQSVSLETYVHLPKLLRNQRHSRNYAGGRNFQRNKSYQKNTGKKYQAHEENKSNYGATSSKQDGSKSSNHANSSYVNQKHQIQQKPTKEVLISLESSAINVCSVGNRQKFKSRITRTAIINDTKIDFLLDTGAEENKLSEKGYKKIAAGSSNVKLNRYSGPKINSASGNLPILGTLTVE